MNHDAFIGQVQHRARLASRGEAERATRAVLETLAERLEAGLADNVAAQLPPEIGLHMRVPEFYKRLSFDDFIDLVAVREGVDRPEAAFHARVVLEVLGEATTGLMDKIRDSLPAEFQPLFAGSQGEMPPVPQRA